MSEYRRHFTEADSGPCKIVVSNVYPSDIGQPLKIYWANIEIATRAYADPQKDYKGAQRKLSLLASSHPQIR